MRPKSKSYTTHNTNTHTKMKTRKPLNENIYQKTKSENTMQTHTQTQNKKPL